jgi:putative PEP-CTERM system TPR-repeat lipoprotein
MFDRPSAEFNVSTNCPFRRLALALAIASLTVACSRDPISAGNEHFKNQNYSAAVIEYKNAVQDRPDELQARLALAEALERTFDTVGAEQHLRKALERGGDANALWPRIAMLLLERKEHAKLINEFKDKILDSKDANSELHAAVAVAYLAQDQIADAEAQLSKAESRDTPAVKLASAQLQLRQGHSEKAAAVLDSSIAKPDSPWWVLRGLGRIAEATGKKDRAQEFMRQAYENAQWHWGVAGEYAEFLMGSNRVDEAIAIHTRLERMAPDYYWTNYVNALILAKQGKGDESQSAALRVLKVAPTHLPANLLVSSAELRKGDVRMANLRLQKIALQHPYSLTLLQLLAESQLRLGIYSEAADSIRRGLGVAPKDPTLLSLQADLDVIKGNLKSAANTLETLRVLQPDSAAHALRLSELRLKTGKSAEAKELLEDALKHAGSDPAQQERIVAAYLGMGEIQRVQQLAESAVQQRPTDPGAFLMLAAAAGAKKQNDEAWKQLEKALDLEPAFQGALRAMSLLASTPAQQEQLFNRYAKAVDSKRASEQTLLSYARQARSRGIEPQFIVGILEKGLTQFPDSATVRQALVLELIKQGKPETALKTAQTGASSNGATPEALALLGVTYQRQGELRLATETFRKLATNYPLRHEYRLKLAELEIAGGQQREATSILRALMTDRPFDPEAFSMLAKLTAPSSLREARSIAQEMGRNEINAKSALLLEGDILLQHQQFDDALKIYNQAAKAGAQPGATLRTVQLLDKTNRGAAADGEMNDALRKFPNDLSVLGFAAQRLRAKGNSSEAIKLLQMMSDQNPQNPIVANDLAWAQAELKHPEALKNALRANQIAPDNPVILDTLGIAYLSAGKHAEAISALRTSLSLAPQSQPTKLHLASALLAGGSLKDATTIVQGIDQAHLANNEQEDLKRIKSQLGN